VIDSVENLMREFIEQLGDPNSIKLYEKIPTGKRLRAKLILKIASTHELSPKLAAVVELIHAASLLHDDVIDDADTRRGKASVNALFGDKTAIMLGDILYSRAFYELVSFDKEIAKTISLSVSQLSVGELLDVELSKSFTPNKSAYFDMIYKKTASLIEASAKSAALLCKKDEQSFALYGKNLGLAFQIIDDVLDVTQDSKTLGKPSLNDFKEGKTTLPYIYLYNSLDDKDKEKLKNLYKKELSEKEIKWIKEQMAKHKAIQKCIELAKKLSYEALEAIKEFKNSELERVITDMIERDF